MLAEDALKLDNNPSIEKKMEFMRRIFMVAMNIYNFGDKKE